MKTMKILLTIALAISMIAVSAQSYHRLTRGGISGTDLAMMLIDEGFDDYILQAQKDLPKVTAKKPARPTVPQWPDPDGEWLAYKYAMRAYRIEYKAQLQAREDHLNEVAYQLQHTWLLQNEAYMKVCPNPRNPSRKQWCWHPYDWSYRQWANILLQVWRKLPTYPSNFVSYHQNDHRIQYK
jgi:hypothetical protein